jgi:hypothetical protein
MVRPDPSVQKKVHVHLVLCLRRWEDPVLVECFVYAEPGLVVRFSPSWQFVFWYPKKWIQNEPELRRVEY